MNIRRKDRQFKIGDMVPIHLRLECFPPSSFTKLHVRRVGPFRVTKKLGPNAYVIDLPFNFSISLVFNIEDLTEFKSDEAKVSTTLVLEAWQDSIIRVPQQTTHRY